MLSTPPANAAARVPSSHSSTDRSMHCSVQLAAFIAPAHSTATVVPPRRHVLDVIRASSCAQGRQQQQHQSWQMLRMEHSTHILCSTSCRFESQQDMLQQGLLQLQNHVHIQQTATAESKADGNHRRQQQQQLSQCQPKTLSMQQQQPLAVTDSAVRNELQACSSWTTLANYLLQQVQLAHHQDHQQQQQQQQQVPMQAELPHSSSSNSASKRQQQQHNARHKQLLWQQLNGYQARLVVQRAAQLVAAQQRLRVQVAAGNIDAANHDALRGALSPPSRLQQPLALLLRRAVLRAAASPGDAVVAADLLRSVWRLGALQQQQLQQQRQQQQQNKKLQQQKQQLGQQVLNIMCAGHLPASKSVVAAAAAAKRQQRACVQNANLLADVAQSVIQLQLQPSDEWLAWYGHASLALLQQQQQGQVRFAGQNLSQRSTAEYHRRPSSYFLVSSLCLACYTHNMQQQQQALQHQQRALSNDSWLQAWGTAAAQLPHPFSNSQLLQVLSAAQQLQLQLPSSFWQAHLSAAAVHKLSAQQLLQLLVQLPPLVQRTQQEGMRQWKQEKVFLLPAEWRAAAADLMVLHVSSAGAPAAVLRLLPRAVTAALQLQLPLQQGSVQQLLQVLLQERTAGAALGSRSSSSSNSSSSSISSNSNMGTNGAQLLPRSSSILCQSGAKVAASAVTTLAQLSISQPPTASLLAQLQQQLTPKLQRCNMQSLVDLLWVFAVKWRVQPTKPWLSGFLAATEPLLGYSSAKQLRMLIVGLSLLQVAVPESWMRVFLQATAAVMAGGNASSSSGNNSSSAGSEEPPQQQQQQRRRRQQDILSAVSTRQRSAAFLGNVAYSLVQLQVTPNSSWQLAWHSAVTQHAQHMSPDQLTDALYAAAAWAESEQCGAAAVAMDNTAAASPPAAVGSELHMQPAAAAAAGSSSSASVAGAQVSEPAAAATAAGARQYSSAAPHLLPKPQRRWPDSTSSDSCAPCQAAAYRDTAGQGQQRLLRHGQPRDVWVRGLLQHLRQLLPRCTPTHLTTALWCLRPLQYKASVPWLDVVCDTLLGQLQQCNMVQLQQLLRSLLHQGHILAPARIDAVLDAALAVLSKGKVHCSEQQLVWLLQLVVLLHHEPEPEWTEQVAAAAERMLCSSSSSERKLRMQHAVSSSSLHTSSTVADVATATTNSSSSSSNSGWSPGLLTDLLDAISQLGGRELPASWATSYRNAARCCLPHFTGLQLARVLAAAAFLHWEIPRPFLQLLLLQLQRHMHSMDVHALGLVGVAVGQMGLLMGRRWAQQYMARVMHLARHRSVRIPVSDVANLQRSVQYLRWCGGRTRVLNQPLQRRATNWSRAPGGRRFRMRLKRYKVRMCSSHFRSSNGSSG